MGNEGFTFVQIGNLLAIRVVLIIILCNWRGLRWLLEQPSSSSMDKLPRYQWLWSVVRVLGLL